MKGNHEKLLFDALGLICCLVPAICCTCAYFPVWKETVGAWHMAGGTVAIIAIIVFIVLSKYFSARMKTPSPVVASLVFWLMFELIYRVIDGLRTISMWLFIGCAVGAVFFWLAERADKKGS